ncbi:C45 family peptidase [Flammeovirga yaeyamensis]|uniref:C45 family peptidase n=1 Tax=Flammeovirga yaeyamensis TaxID=367791 RepID=A0AAX1N3E3_9BACT|nr:C45 family peptidase [Flammeovirga yaeyamensis]MBB3700640.1 putative choloylglycine hydrolase [Flammeovirga yaeyamensis]NMF37756.1 hypothetical protein [Flammeovirga yaeyamensis]QWG02064.1 C45 family peptidase [Flammeovirga yaeyamensis]
MRKLIIASILLIALLLTWTHSWLFIPKPFIDDDSIAQYQLDSLGRGHFVYHKNFISKQKDGLWELYTEGSPFDIGYATGVLTKELFHDHEEAFISKIIEHSPFNSDLGVRLYHSLFHRHVDNNILPEYKEEIYGLAQHAKKEYAPFGNNYQRVLNYHGLYDLERSFDDVELNSSVSFAISPQHTNGNGVLIGRNFEYDINKDFQREKIIHFVKPDEGFKFASITWGGFIGTVTGMNEMGLTVSTHPIKSDFPTNATYPVSIIGREILQYAMTADEAYNIALTKKSYVIESFLVSSAFDSSAVLIEMTPTGVDSIHLTSDDALVATNHLQNTRLSEGEIYDLNHATYYKSIRLKELIYNQSSFDVNTVASILRDTKGFENTTIGFGNHKSINALNLHHSVIFKPKTRQMWVSTHHRQLGKYYCYNLDSVFSNINSPKHSLASEEHTLSEAEFIYSQEYRNYHSYKSFVELISKWRPQDEPFKDKELMHFKRLNPESFETYEHLGDYYTKLQDWDMAEINYRIALSKEVSSIDLKNKIEKKLYSINY